MKNLIAPNILATFQQQPTPIEEIVKYLDNNDNISTIRFCQLIGIHPRKVYDYRAQQKRKNLKQNGNSIVDVTPKAASRSQIRYTAKEKFTLVKEYLKANELQKTELFRRYGLYQSDIQRWLDQVEEVAISALGTRKIRSDKKSEEQLQIEQLKSDLQEQEKTSAKLSALLVVQKKVFDILKKHD